MSKTWPEAVIDPHIHQWNPYTTPRQASRKARLLRLIPRIPRVVLYAAPRRDREYIADPQYVLKPYLTTDYLRDTGALPVTSVVHVEAMWGARTPVESADETRWVAALPFGKNGAPELGAIVAHADPRSPHINEILDAHQAASPLVNGVRFSAAHHPDPDVRDFTDHPNVLASVEFLRGFAAVADRNLNFELWLYSHQLPDAVALAREFPQTTFILNHYATPVGLFGPRGRHTGQTAHDRNRILHQWRENLAALGELPNTVAKHSGLGMPLLGGPPESGASLIRHLHDVFGPDRTMWASNFPIDKPGHSIVHSARLVLDVLGSDAEPQKLFHDVAEHTYRPRLPVQPKEGTPS